jgi:hypothetical protein
MEQDQLRLCGDILVYVLPGLYLGIPLSGPLTRCGPIVVLLERKVKLDFHFRQAGKLRSDWEHEK